MTIDALIMLLGTFVAVVSFLGFPASWDTALLLLAGAGIIFLGIIVRRRGLRPPRPHSRVRESDVFAESAPDEHREAVHEEM